MAKAYWITFYRSIKDKDALAQYARLARSAIKAAGGRFLVRGAPVKTYEAGLGERTINRLRKSFACSCGADTAFARFLPAGRAGS